MAYPSTLHHHHNPDWCFWSIGLWGCVWKFWLQWKWPPEWQLPYSWFFSRYVNSANFADVDHSWNLTPRKKPTTHCSVWAFGRPIRENKIVKNPKISHSRNLSTSKKTNYTRYSAEWQPFGTIAKELMPIICSCVVWDSQLARKSILIQCDNLSLVMAINKGSCRDKLVMQLSGILTILVAHFDMHITSTHISGTLNLSADHLSWLDMSYFFSLNPQATRHSIPLPQPLLQLVSANGPDWTSSLFRELFADTLAMV